MNASKVIIGITAFAIMAGTAFAVVQIKSRQRLGNPGVKVGPIAICDERGKTVSSVGVLLPEAAAGFSSQTLPITDQELTGLPKDTVFGRRLYSSRDGLQIQNSVILMGADRTSLHEPEFCLPSQGWTVDQKSRAVIGLEKPSAHRLPVQKWTL